MHSQSLFKPSLTDRVAFKDFLNATVQQCREMVEPLAFRELTIMIDALSVRQVEIELAFSTCLTKIKTMLKNASLEKAESCLTRLLLDLQYNQLQLAESYDLSNQFQLPTFIHIGKEYIQLKLELKKINALMPILYDTKKTKQPEESPLIP